METLITVVLIFTAVGSTVVAMTALWRVWHGPDRADSPPNPRQVRIGVDCVQDYVSWSDRPFALVAEDTPIAEAQSRRFAMFFCGQETVATDVPSRTMALLRRSRLLHEPNRKNPGHVKAAEALLTRLAGAIKGRLQQVRPGEIPQVTEQEAFQIAYLRDFLASQPGVVDRAFRNAIGSASRRPAGGRGANPTGALMAAMGVGVPKHPTHHRSEVYLEAADAASPEPKAGA